ncbi:MAG: hypothetical protein D5R96_07900 [Methanocalculus sp. MSAO_Arc2]|nr:MAG: hypothetical protein D5R96_07900 [Methanocalculus sp. MSAO_Arc2]
MIVLKCVEYIKRQYDGYEGPSIFWCILIFKRVYPLLVLALVLLAGAGCVSEDPETPPEPAKTFHTFDESNDGETYTVPVGPGFVSHSLRVRPPVMSGNQRPPLASPSPMKF